jgi:hypothetical protein
VNVVMACYFTGRPDEQRELKHWPADSTRLVPLIKSIRGATPVILHDCFGPEDWPGVFRGRTCRVPPLDRSAYVFRWWAFREWLYEHLEKLEKVWCVDATDVVMLNEPWMDMADGCLYVGQEPGTLGGNPWVIKHAGTELDWVWENANERVLNPGVVGGDADTMLWLTNRMWEETFNKEHPQQEFVTFNRVAREHELLVFGPRVTTPYKQYVGESEVSWWAHK